MNEEMRKEFEDFYINKYGVIAICSGNYTSERAIEQWDAWQASREAMKPIKLPKLMKNTQEQSCYYYNDAIEECKEAIQQAGCEVAE
jgi:predicted DNA-binding protein